MKNFGANLILKNCTPELILAFVGTSLFLSNVSNAAGRVLCWLIILLLFAFCKCLMTANVLRTEIIFSGNNRFMNYGFLLIEFGIMLNLYIVGFTENSTHVLNYLFGLIKPLAIFISIDFIFQVLASHDRYHHGKAVLSIAVSLFLIWGFSIPETLTAEAILRTVSVPVLETGLIFLSLVLLYGLLSDYHAGWTVKKIRKLFEKLCESKYSSFKIFLFYGAICALISLLALTGIFDRNGMLTARVAAVELLKLCLLSSLAMMQCVNAWKLRNPDEQDKFLENLRYFLQKYDCKASLNFVWTAVFFGVTVIPLMLCGEFGTCLILLVLLVLMSSSCFNITFSLTEIVFCTGGYLILKKCYLMGLFDAAAEAKLNRMFALDGFIQINDMNTIIDESNMIFQVIPYHVQLTGQLTTRIEDFSYLNIISVFGTAFAAVFVIYLLTVPYLTLSSFDEWADNRKSLYFYNLFTVSKWPLLLFMANVTVHVMSNLGIFMFTGVTLPLVSNGFMNTIITVLSFIPVMKCLGVIEHEKTT